MKTEILKKEEELRLAMIDSNIEKLDELIDDSLMFTGPNGIIVTKDMDLQAHKSKIQKMTKLNPSEQQIKIHDNFAVVAVKIEMTGTYGEMDISGLYRYLRVWTKIQGDWKVVAGSVIKFE